MKRILKSFANEMLFMFTNYIICYIPLWTIRKLLYRLCGMKIGKGSRIMMHVRIYAPHKIVIGERSVINEWCYLDGRGGITVGNDVTIATFSKLITAAHSVDDEKFAYYSLPILLKDNVAVFSDSLVLGGATINEGCVISAKSLVRKGDYSKRGIYAGNPAKFIRDRKCNADYNQDIVKVLFR